MSLADALIGAIEQLRAHGTPLHELRLHPDDVDALESECAEFLTHPAPPGPETFNGLPLVRDPNAPRRGLIYWSRAT